MGESAMFTRNDQRAIVAEFLGTLFFVFLGTGAVVAAIGVTGGLDAAALVAIAIAHGLGILIAVAWTANLSGGHINPAVTVGLFIAKHISGPLAVAYIVAQLAGAAAGSLLLKLVIPDDIEGQTKLGLHSINPGMATVEGLGMEIILTAFLVLVIFNVAVSARGWGNNAPIAIGLAVMAIHFIAVPWTGASVNTARSFGPALVMNDWADFWVYIVGPVVGGAIIGVGWLFFKDMGDDALDETAEA